MSTNQNSLAMEGRTRKVSAFALASLASLVLSAVPCTRAEASRLTNADVTLVSFGSMQGELVTCGCHASPKGGLARRSAVLDSLRAREMPFLHLELGDFSKIDELSGDYETRFIWSIFEKTGVDALAPGPREITMWNTLEALRSSGTIPVISSNLTVTHDGHTSPAGRPFAIVERNGLRVALFSLIGTSQVTQAHPPEGLTFEAKDPVETARELVPQLHQQADVVVLMSQLDPAETEQLVRQVPGIDVALDGQRASFEDRPQQVGHTIVNQTGMRGQYVGELTLIVGPGGETVDYGARNFALDNKVAEDPAISTLVSEAQARVKEMKDEQQKSRQAAADAKGDGTTAH